MWGLYEPGSRVSGLHEAEHNWWCTLSHARLRPRPKGQRELFLRFPKALASCWVKQENFYKFCRFFFFVLGKPFVWVASEGNCKKESGAYKEVGRATGMEKEDSQKAENP